MRYEHSQIGYLTICVLFGAAVFVAVMGIIAPADQSGLRLTAVIEVILLICAVLFSKLTIKIDDETLRACFAMGFICKKCRWRRLPCANQSASVGGTVGEFT